MSHRCHLSPSFRVVWQELRELQASIKDTSVVVQMDNTRSLNMEQIVTEVKAQYEEIAARSREEAEAWYKSKVRSKKLETPTPGCDFVAPHRPQLNSKTRVRDDVVSTFSSVQFDQMSVQASQYGDELRVVKSEVGEVNRLIGRLQSEIEAIKAQV